MMLHDVNIYKNIIYMMLYDVNDVYNGKNCGFYEFQKLSFVH